MVNSTLSTILSSKHNTSFLQFSRMLDRYSYVPLGMSTYLGIKGSKKRVSITVQSQGLALTDIQRTWEW